MFDGLVWQVKQDICTGIEVRVTQSLSYPQNDVVYLPMRTRHVTDRMHFEWSSQKCICVCWPFLHVNRNFSKPTIFEPHFVQC
jgi:hypothetical protein